jgi:hypothetical protein
MWLENEPGVRSHGIDIFDCERIQLLAVKRVDVGPLKSRHINSETVTSPGKFRVAFQKRRKLRAQVPQGPGC